MKRILVVLTTFLLFLHPCFAQQDTIFIYNNQVNAEIKVCLNDYLKKTNAHFKDSIKYSIQQYFKSKSDTSNNELIEDRYFISLAYYDYHEHPIIFDKIIMELLDENKVSFIKNGITYKKEAVQIRSKKIYRCNNKSLYMGQNYEVVAGKLILGSFIKSRNRNAYRLISCF
jgi:hypothetical protein